MGETSDPPWMTAANYAAAAASDASRKAGMANTQMERLLSLLIVKGIITQTEASYCLHVPF